ncbi:hypothetical protein PGB90_002194 [Kerria lacca]
MIRILRWKQIKTTLIAAPVLDEEQQQVGMKIDFFFISGCHLSVSMKFLNSLKVTFRKNKVDFEDLIEPNERTVALRSMSDKPSNGNLSKYAIIFSMFESSVVCVRLRPIIERDLLNSVIFTADEPLVGGCGTETGGTSRLFLSFFLLPQQLLCLIMADLEIIAIFQIACFDSPIFEASVMGQKFVNGTMNLPLDRPLLNQNESTPYVFLKDEAFALKTDEDQQLGGFENLQAESRRGTNFSFEIWERFTNYFNEDV